MKINKGNSLEKISLFLITFYIFFGYIVKKETMQLFITTAFVLLTLISIKEYTIRLYKNDFHWIIIFILSIISLIYSIDKDSTIRYDICLGLILLIKIMLNNFKGKSTNILKYIIFFSSIHVIATILYLIFPEFIQSICRLILTPQMYNYNIALMRHGANAGICSEHGFNAFCITVFINIFFVKTVYNSQNKKRDAILTLIGIITLLTTGKRGLLIANVLAMIIIFLIVNATNKHNLKRFFLAIILVFIIFMIINYIPATQVVFERFKELDLSGNLLNGREVFYENMLNNISENPIIGSGVSTTQKITSGNDGHNIYLQIFSELGIVGMIAYVYTFSYVIINTIRKIKNKENLEIILISLYFQIFFLIYGISGNPLYNFSILLTYMIMINLTTKITKKTVEE